METVLRAAALAAVVVLLVGVLLKTVASQFQPVDPDGLLRDFKTRGLAMELVRAPAEVDRILGNQNNWNREVMTQQQFVDFAFIAAYWLLFVLSAVLLGQFKFEYAKYGAILVTICASAAAVCDVWEDVFILKLVKATGADPIQSWIDACRHFALGKWSLLFAAMLLLSPLFWWRPDWKTFTGFLFVVAGFLLVATGAAGLIGLLSLSSGTAIEGATKLMGLSMLALTIILGWCAFQPARLLGP